jgi:sugar lactone lactonase YvrE
MKRVLRIASCWLYLVCLGLVFSHWASVCRADLWGLSSPGNGTPAPGTENNYNKVFRFDEQGNKLANDIPTSAGAYFPTGIAVGPDGNIYVSAYGIGSILRFDGQTGASLGPFATGFGPAQLAFGPDGNLYVSEFFGTAVRTYDAHAGANFGTRLADAATGLTSAQGLAFAANGDLLVGDGFAQAAGQHAKIVRVHNGAQSTWGFTDQCSELGCSFYAPVAMLTQANGDVLVVDMLANYVARVSDFGVPSFFASINPPVAPPSTNFPSDITFDPNGNIVISTLGETNPPDNRGALWRYDLSGNIIDPDNDATPNEPIVSGIEPIAGIDYTPSLKTFAGDFNGDNSVTAADFTKWRTDHGKFVAQGNGADGNSNGVVDAADYVLWRKAASAGSGTAAASIPEPTTVILLLGGLFVLSAVRRQPRRG